MMSSLMLWASDPANLIEFGGPPEPISRVQFRRRARRYWLPPHKAVAGV